MKVPFSDVKYSEEEIQAVSEVLRTGWASRGKLTEEFEARLGKYLGSKVLCVNNGSSALMCALLANGVKAGDTVLVPDFTYAATAMVPAILGCKIIPVDADLETFMLNGNVDMGMKAWVWTDVAGLPSGNLQQNPDYPIVMIEDAAEALGAETTEGKTGSADYLTIFSFQTTKQLNTIEGGAIASKDEELIAKCRKIADYGRTEERYVHDTLGMNFRFTDVQAAIGLIELEHLDANLRRRQEIAERYRKGLPQFTFQKIHSYVTRHAWWAVLALAKDYDERESLLSWMNVEGVDARRPWWPIHLQPCFPELRVSTDKHFAPNALELWKRGLLLPIFNSMENEQIDRVIEVANQ